MTVRGETPSGARQVSPIFISFRASATDAVFSFFISFIWCLKYFSVTLSAKLIKTLYM